MSIAPPENVSYFWPASGFLLAILALAPPARWASILLVVFPTGVLLNMLGAGRGLVPSLGYAVADVLEAWPAALLLLRFGGEKPDFGSRRQVFALVLGAAPVSAVLSAALGAAIATHFGSAGSFLPVFRTWALSVLISNVVVTPFIVTWARSAERGVTARELSEGALVVALLVVVSIFVLGSPSPLPLLYAPFPIALWAALRLGPRGAATASLAFAVIAVVLAAGGVTPFALASSTALRVQWMQGLIGTMAVSALALAAGIAEQNVTAARLREAEARHRLIVEGAPIGMVLTTSTGEILHANAAFGTLLGRPVAEITGRKFAEFTHPDDVTANLEVLAEIVRGGRERASFEKRYLHRDGRVIQTLLHIAALRAEDGRFLNTITIVEDVSQRRRLEAQLLDAQKMEAVGKLAGGVAHDFNNLLGVILAQAYLAGRGGADAKLTTALADITDAAQRGAGLTRQLLAFARRQVVEPKVLDLNTLARDLLNLLRRLISEDIELRFEPADQLWPVRIDPSQFEQIVVNLAVNARDAMPNGGTLTIRTGNVALTRDEGEVGPGDWTVLTVADSGVGMDEDLRRHVFEPFFTTKERGKGTGLGLATVHGIVSQSGGRITLSSEPGRGTTFRIWLKRALQAHEANPPRTPVPPAGSETVLVVEDEAAVRRVVCDVLRERGYTVLEAGDADAALALSRAHPGAIDLLVTDVIMPGKSGRALADALSVERPATIVLFTSGYTDDLIAHHGVLDEGVLFLQKPYTPADLVEKVRQALSAR